MYSQYVNVLKSLKGINYVEGEAHLIVNESNHAWQVKVDDKIYTGDACIIATGSRTSVPDIPGISDTPYLTHESLYELQELPESMIVLGGGYIALENAQMVCYKLCVLRMLKHAVANVFNEPVQYF